MNLPTGVHARWASAERAPLTILNRVETIKVSLDGSWTLTGTVEYRINTDQGRSIMAAFRFPLGDELTQTKILSAEIYPPSSQSIKTRTIDPTTITLRDVDPNQINAQLFLATQTSTIPFGDLPVGTVTKISYTSEQKKPRIAGLFSKNFIWGIEYPEMSGSLSLEAREPLNFDISKGARNALNFAKGKQPDGTFLWKVELKNPIYLKTDGEQGGLLTTAVVPRLQISNKNSWTSLVEVLSKNFVQGPNDIFPRELQKIVDTTKPIRTLNERLNQVIEMLHQIVIYNREWSRDGDGLQPQKLASLVTAKGQQRRGDSKDFAFATAAVLKALGYDADVALVWRQTPTEKILIEELPTTPSLDLFNHAIVRLNYDGKPHFFDPSNQVAFGDGFLSDIGGSWVLTLRDKPGIAPSIERLPNESPMASQIKIIQTLDVRPDASVVGSGTAKIEGPLAAELKHVYFAQGAAQVEPYLRSLLGLSLKSETINPMIRLNTEDRRGKTLELSYSYLAPSAVAARGTFRDFDISTAGLAGVPLLGTPDRATDVILSKNLILEVETKVTGGEVVDETNTSCLVLTSFASLLRETRVNQDSFTISDHLQFKTDRISAAATKTIAFQNEMNAYTSCLLRTRTSIGPRPAYERSQLGLSQNEIMVLKKPVTLMTLQDLRTLDNLNSPQLNSIVSLKRWLSTREMLRRNIRSASVMLEYANSLLLTGRVQNENDESYLAEHINIAASLFGAAGIQRSGTAEFNRIHATMLLATNRPKEALIAIRNAMTMEKGQAKDAFLTGKIYLSLGDSVKAEYWFNQVTTQSSSKTLRIAALVALSKIRLRQKNLKDFIAFYNRAINEAPMNAWIYHEFATELNRMKLWDLAIEQSRKALNLQRFSQAELLLASSLIGKAESIYFSAPGIPTIDNRVIEAAERLAVECLKYNRQTALAYRIAGHATFLKAMHGDYSSLIATQSYFAKAVELGLLDPWVQDRLAIANQALESSRPLAQVWVAYMAAKSRTPANILNQRSTPSIRDSGSQKFPVR